MSIHATSHTSRGRRRGAVIAAVLATSALASPPALAAPGDNAVVHWNQVTLDTINTDSARRTPSAASLYVGIAQAAVYDAAMAIEGSHAPYAYDGDAPGASIDAAVATAAHDVLAAYFPARQSELDTELALSLGQVPDGAAEDAGVSTGRAAAQAIIARRANDGRDTPVAAPADGTLAGQWRRTGTGSVVTPYVAQVTPFLAQSPSQFRPGGPRSLTSERYAEEFNHTRLYGAKTGSLRSPEQTEIAVFWTDNTAAQLNRALRGLASARGLSPADSARMFAMTTIPGADAMITCWNTKFHYLSWRPVTAIRNADTDGNPLTTADPAWEPLSVTGLHPEYTSGHACLTGAITRGLQEFLGTKKIDLTIDSAVNAGVHRFTTIDDLRTEVQDARVYGGDHWTTGGIDGTRLGDDLAAWALKRYFLST